jgi:DNA primase
MPGIDYERVRPSVSMKQVLDLLAFKAIEIRGEQLRGPCPIHNSKGSKSRSFVVSLRKNAFHCFECGAHGNQLDLLVAVTRRPLFEAAKDLCRQAGIEVPLIRRW